MKVLFISTKLPANNGSGEAMRSHQLLEELKTFAEVDTLVATHLDVDAGSAQAFSSAGNRYLGTVHTPRSHHMYKLEVRLNGQIAAILAGTEYDAIVVRYYNTAYWLGLFGQENLVLDCDDCFLEIIHQHIHDEEYPRRNIFWKLYAAAYFRVYRLLYARNLSRAREVIFTKKSTHVKWRSHYSIIRNKIPAPEASRITPPPGDNTTVKALFIGDLNYYPNFYGLEHFITSIWPVIAASCENLSLKIVGGNLPEQYRQAWSGIPRIELCGFVEDIDRAYGDTHFSIVPIYRGSGTHIKIMESLIRGRTLVISRFAHRGYEHSLLDGESLFVAGSDAEFASRVIELVRNPELRAALADRGRAKVIEHHIYNGRDTSLKDVLLANEKAASGEFQGA
jgi:glycosyltransferase involved in cell wall biosynthesis